MNGKRYPNSDRRCKRLVAGKKNGLTLVTPARSGEEEQPKR
jgi:hypothetical protein